MPGLEWQRRDCMAGVDEAGRGALAGPVIAAAVMLDNTAWTAIDGLDDSKRLSARQRESLARCIQAKALAWSIGRAEVSEVDRLNVLEASMLAMRRALRSLNPAPAWVAVDGNRFPDPGYAGECVIGGDGKVPEIMAASILAKVWRDREMCMLDALYPGYGFVRHKGYPTRAHRDHLQVRGPSAIHRLSFAPVRACSSGLGG